MKKNIVQLLRSHGGLHAGGRGLPGSAVAPSGPVGQRRAAGGPSAGRARGLHRQPGLVGQDGVACRRHNRELALSRGAAALGGQRQLGLRPERPLQDPAARVRRARPLDQHREAARVQLEPAGHRQRRPHRPEDLREQRQLKVLRHPQEGR